MSAAGYLLLGLLFGAAFGFLLGLMYGRSRSVRVDDGLVSELRQQLSQRDSDLGCVRQELTEKAASSAAAEEKAKLVPGLREEIAHHEQRLTGLAEELTALKSTRAELETTLAKEREATQEKLALLTNAQKELSDAFKALAAEALRSNNQSFLELAQTKMAEFHKAAQGDLEKRQQAIVQFLAPVKETLGKFDAEVRELEKTRVAAYEGLTTQVKNLLELQTQLRDQTSNLVRALGTPRVRGRWGEIQLRRVVELAGMLDHCDFEEQVSVESDDGRLRPDLVVHLPGGKNIVVDAKAPLAAYLEALEVADNSAKDAKLRDHARQIRDHMAKLSRKSYWDQFAAAPEFVVLFLPGENFFSAALQQDPELIEQGVEQRVLLATPTTLISLLKAVAYGWRQENLAANAREISDLGKELYKRILDMAGHFADLGARLGKAVESYNRAIGSLENRVLVSARRFHELETTGTQEELAPALPVDITPRQLQAPGLAPIDKQQLGL